MLRVLILILSLIAAQAADSKPPARFSFTWHTNNQHSVLLKGQDLKALISARAENLETLLQVHVELPDLRSSIGLPAVKGEYAITEHGLEFRPHFPFAPGVRYRATFHAPGGTLVSSTFEMEKPVLTPSTVVSEIYPTADQLPENLLKFYIYFSAPMSGGHIYEHIQLTDELDEPVELPFLEINEELWNPEMTRLTLFLDPGRIKRGVKPLEEVGPALEANKRYTLSISPSWLDANGTPLKKGFQKKFRVTSADRDAPAIASWKIRAPKPGTRDPLEIEFPDPMDHALALRMIHIENVRAEKTLGNNETLLRLTPEQPWRAGKHRLLVQTTIEDLAGNNIGKPFEVDLFDGVQRRITNNVASREITID